MEIGSIRPLFLAAGLAAALVFPASVRAQDPSWELIRPNGTWDNEWKVEPGSRALDSAIDEPIYSDQRPLLTSDRASATRPRQRFAVGFLDVDPITERFAGGQLWMYIGIRKHTRVDVAIRTRRDGRVVTVSSARRLTPPVAIAPEDPPVGRNGFRDWLPLAIPALTRDEANRLSLAVRISPSSPRRSLSRVYAAFAELYPEGS